MNRKSRAKLWLYFIGIIFVTMFNAFLLFSGCWFALYKLNIIQIDPRVRHIPVAMFLMISVLLGTSIVVFVGRVIILPLKNIIDAFDELSKGNFSVKVPVDGGIEEIREMSRHFNAMTYDLEHIETLRTDFVANVSHEFKTPIAAIEGYATLLQNPELTPEKHAHYLEIILDNSRRLSTLSSNVLTLSKLENQELIVDKREFRLDEQIRKAILLLETKWESRNIEFDMELPRQMYYGSEPLLTQVWINILDNAIKYSTEGGVISVNIRREQAYLTVTVSDHGEGMTQEVQKHAFEKFYQGDRSRKTEGNGLGLALVKRIVDLCGGFVTVKSEPGKGTDFSVHLPL